MPRKGDLAFCRHGYLGLITEDKPQHESSVGGNIGAEIWVGVQLSTKNGRRVGGPWQSREPDVIGYAPELVEIIEKARKYDDFNFLEMQREIAGRGDPPQYVPQPYEPPRHNDIYSPRADYNPAPQLRNGGGQL